MAFDLNGFIQTVFLDRIAYGLTYNLIETLVYAGLLIGVAFLVVYPLLNRLGVKFNFRFGLALLPYIALGSMFRVLSESYSNAYILQKIADPFTLNFYFVTPGIYVVFGLGTIAALLVSWFVGRRLGRDYVKIFAGIGVVAVLPLLVFMLTRITHPLQFLGIIGLVLLIVFGTKAVFGRLGWKLLKDKLNIMAYASQALDATATYVALTFFSGFGEQHLVSGLLMGAATPLSFFVKLLIILVILYYVDKEVENENLKAFIKIFLLILGFATGTRDTFSVGLTLLS